MRLLVVSVVAGFLVRPLRSLLWGEGGDEHLELGNCTTHLDPLYGSKEPFWMTSLRYLNSYPAGTFRDPRDGSMPRRGARAPGQGLKPHKR